MTCKPKRIRQAVDRSMFVTAERVLDRIKCTSYLKTRKRRAEHLIADEGVFLGHEGLRGLAEHDAFWSKQDYGTRLYYGDGNFDYLHRSVLRAAIAWMDKQAAAPKGAGHE